MTVCNDGAMTNSSGISYYRARYYDPIIGRFVSGDPIGHNGGINIFAYVGNSSADLVDPTGYYAQLDPNSRCAEVFAKAFKPGLCPDEYAKDFNQRASKIPVINVPSDKSPTAKLTENQVSGNGSLKTLGSHFFGVTYTPTAITLAGGKPVIVLGTGFSNQPQDVQYGTLIHEEVHGVTGYGDEDIFDMLRKYGLPSTDFILDPAHPTGEFTEWIRKGCPPKKAGTQ
jgi:RHS repeat-associated protein